VSRKLSPFWIALATLLLIASVMYLLILMLKKTYQNGQNYRHTVIFLEVLEQALVLYRSDHGVFPPPEDGGLALLSTTVDKRLGCYFRLSKVHRDDAGRIVDYWKRPLIYRIHNERPNRQRLELYSVGPNGKDEGGQGDDIVVD